MMLWVPRLPSSIVIKSSSLILFFIKSAAFSLIRIGSFWPFMSKAKSVFSVWTLLIKNYIHVNNAIRIHYDVFCAPIKILSGVSRSSLTFLDQQSLLIIEYLECCWFSFILSAKSLEELLIIEIVVIWSLKMDDTKSFNSTFSCLYIFQLSASYYSSVNIFRACEGFSRFCSSFLFTVLII